MVSDVLALAIEAKGDGPGIGLVDRIARLQIFTDKR